MSSASGSMSYLAIVKQDPTKPKEIPTNPAMQKVNFVSDDLSENIKTKVSDHIRGDRMTNDIAIVGMDIAGGYEFEMQYNNSGGGTDIDPLILGFLWQATWTDNGDGTFTASNGMFYQPFYIERGHPDVSEYFQFIGMSCNIWKMTYTEEDFVMGNYSFVGLQSETVQAPPTGATYTDPTDNPIINTVTNVDKIWIDGVEQTDCLVKSWDIEINNNVTGRKGTSVQGSCSTAAHRLSITGKITMYFADSTMYQRFKAGTPFSFAWNVVDDLGNEYLFTLPKVKLDEDKVNVSGIDDDVLDDASFTALADNATGAMITIVRTPAP